MSAIQSRAFAQATVDIRGELSRAMGALSQFDEAARDRRDDWVDDLFVSDAVLDPYAANAFNLAGSYEDELLARGRQLVQERVAGPDYDRADLIAEIGALFDSRFTDARLELIARNEFGKAYNAGRHDLMTHPDVADLVVGFAVDIVLDSRTTDICESWGKANGHKAVAFRNDEEGRRGLSRYGGMLHHQCRKMEVPITTYDDEGEYDWWPNVGRELLEPMAGFGGTA